MKLSVQFKETRKAIFDFPTDITTNVKIECLIQNDEGFGRVCFFITSDMVVNLYCRQVTALGMDCTIPLPQHHTCWGFDFAHH